ncbi:sigma-70 family RNA polymerase sigma factor [Amnibacterium kyonggiense]|uniref:RNA polymerase sigma-28 (SigD/FliA/WhiG) subunit n=1 Tax=Amnibacterium kyonggiense TaxID=595671 RepID=A0A4R7FQN1_9MICO|nr:sigma-70 family RNA polymerase sigma factor [Amnibacterium kyonggiense]TDS80063.1 RNA polymerase sigma-28 (SigD/FliA/WhiG) subunit [Amnibacterium kyonggiense]
MGTRTERDALVRDNLAIVGYLVNEVARKATHVSRDELASAGALGLVLAAESFDPAQGVPFGAFARRRILGAIADEMRSADWASRTARRRIRESLTVQESLTNALGRAPSVDEVAESLGVDRKTAMTALSGANHAVQSLDQMDSVADTLAAEAASPEDVVLETERTRYVKAAVTSLPEKMRYIVEQIYFHDRSVGDLAAELGLTHSAVSQQRSEGIRLMRHGLETQYSTGPVPRIEDQQRLAPARRAAYLARLAETSTARMAQPAAPAFFTERTA